MQIVTISILLHTTLREALAVLCLHLPVWCTDKGFNVGTVISDHVLTIPVHDVYCTRDEVGTTTRTATGWTGSPRVCCFQSDKATSSLKHPSIAENFETCRSCPCRGSHVSVRKTTYSNDIEEEGLSDPGTPVFSLHIHHDLSHAVCSLCTLPDYPEHLDLGCDPHRRYCSACNPSLHRSPVR